MRKLCAQIWAVAKSNTESCGKFRKGRYTLACSEFARRWGSANRCLGRRGLANARALRRWVGIRGLVARLLHGSEEAVNTR